VVAEPRKLRLKNQLPITKLTFQMVLAAITKVKKAAKKSRLLKKRLPKSQLLKKRLPKSQLLKKRLPKSQLLKKHLPKSQQLKKHLLKNQLPSEASLVTGLRKLRCHQTSQFFFVVGRTGKRTLLLFWKFSPGQGISGGLTVSSFRRVREDDVAPMESPSWPG
jgi:hypothetical protein